MRLHLWLFGVLQAEIEAAVATLLSLKAQYKSLTGVDPTPSGGGSSKKDKKKKDKENKAPQQQPKQETSQPKIKQEPSAGDGGREVKKVSRSNITF